MRADRERRIDLMQELRLRRWARLNYRSEVRQDEDGHPVVLDERRIIESEMAATRVHKAGVSTFVPLAPIDVLRIDEPHANISRPVIACTPDPVSTPRLVHNEFYEPR